ncbi:MAG: LPS export ABC transporter permease LptF, partial [Alphaproteobacteria bacterium]|nr:LPS export ABC transporter permease LptF [Alphaproteobacteria bacterium]
MSVLSKYILRQLAAGFALVICSMTILVWLTQSLRLLDMMINNGAPVRLFLYMTMLVMPAFVQVMIPLALFAVILFVFIRMQSDKELIVMQASGMSARQIAAPVLVFTGALVAAGYFFTLVLTPAASLEWREVRFQVRNDLSHLLFQEGQFNSLKKGLTLFIRDRLPSGDVAGVFVYDAQNPKRKSVLAAAAGTIYQQDDGGFALVFKNGTRQEYNPETRKFSLLKFEKYTMNFGSKDSPRQLLATEPREYDLKQLWAASPQTEKNAANYRKARVELAKRLLYPLYAVAFALIALFGVLKGFYSRRGGSRRIHGVILATLLIQSFSLFFENLSSKNLMFLPLMFLNVLVPAAVFYFLTLHVPKAQRAARAALMLLLCLLAAPAGAAQNMVKVDPRIDPALPVDFEADAVSYDRTAGTLTARGHVVLRQDGATLRTERIVYDRARNAISIPAPAVMAFADGTEVHATEATLTDGMRETLAREMTLRLVDGTQMTATGLRRDNRGQDFTIANAMYSPCELCDGRRFWSLTAREISRDTASETMAFKHVFFEFQNVPVMYMPYFMMPDYTVKRKSGFLVPSLSSDRTIKGGLTTPFFWNVAPNQNLILRPTFSAMHAPLVVGDYMGRFAQGF